MPDVTGQFAARVQQGSYRGQLEALRDRLAAGIEQADDRRLVHLAPLAKQLADVLAAIEGLPVAEGMSASDDLRTRRTARRAAAQGQ